MGARGDGKLRAVLIACGNGDRRAGMCAALAGDHERIVVLAAGNEAVARAYLETRGGAIAAVICDEALAGDRRWSPGWALLGEIEIRFPDAYRAMICADTHCARALELLVHGGEPWAREPVEVGRIRARVLSTAVSLPALAIAACGMADELGLTDRQAQIMSAYVRKRRYKSLATALGVGEATLGKDVSNIVARTGLPDMDAVADEVLRRALARPLILRGRGSALTDLASHRGDGRGTAGAG